MAGNELRVILGEGLKVDVETKGFLIKTDQPVHQGGGGTAPSPFDYFLASIAACAGFYVLEFCRTRKLATDEIKVTMTTERGAVSKMVEKVAIAVDLPAEFPEKYTAAVVRAIDQCTVKAHILKAPAFEIVTRRAG
jgi:putative redox protein